MTNGQAARLIFNYKQRWIKAPARFLPPRVFELRSYSAWAAGELIDNVLQSSMPATEVVEEFIAKMDEFSTTNKNSSYMFSVAHDIGVDILDMLIKYEEERKDAT